MSELKLYVIAGEASGDLHGSNLIREIKARRPGVQFRAWGGDKMQEQGATLVRHIKDLAFMGFWEVAKNLRTILGLISQCKKDILSWKPDAIVLIDYPGFNLRIATFARKHKIPVYYYISPQVWAWKANRVKRIKRDVDRMITILPFEQKWFSERGLEVDYVGHPLLDAIEQFRQQGEESANTSQELPRDKAVVAVLPGSRQQEIRKKLPIMLKMAAHFPDHNFVVGGLSQHPASFYREMIPANASNVHIITDNTYGLLNNAKAAMVTSGTATLETALFEVPEVVCYKGNPLSYQLARRLVKVPFISLVNLIADKAVVNELIQADFNEEKLRAELQELLTDSNRRTQLAIEYKSLRQLLGGTGASARTAETLLELIEANSEKFNRAT